MVRDEWIPSAENPCRIEHLFAADADDAASMDTPEIAAGIIGDAQPGRVTAVRNWNAAAAASPGDLIVVIADDLWPSPGWDTAIERLCGDFDPKLAAFVIKVRDSPTAGSRSTAMSAPAGHFHRLNALVSLAMSHLK